VYSCLAAICPLQAAGISTLCFPIPGYHFRKSKQTQYICWQSAWRYFTVYIMIRTLAVQYFGWEHKHLNTPLWCHKLKFHWRFCIVKNLFISLNNWFDDLESGNLARAVFTEIIFRVVSWRTSTTKVDKASSLCNREPCYITTYQVRVSSSQPYSYNTNYSNTYQRNISSVRNLNSPHHLVKQSLCQGRWNTNKFKIL
jgi:hypothetical protein